MPGNEDPLRSLAEERLDLIRSELRAEEKDFLRFYKKPGQPLRRKLFETIYERLAILTGCLSEGARSSPATVVAVQSALALIEEGTRKRDAWQIADSLSAVLPMVFSDPLLHEALLAERSRPKGIGVRWEDRFDAEELKKLIGDYDPEQAQFKSPGSRSIASRHLRELRLSRNDEGRHNRTRARTRARYLTYLGTLLLPLGFVLALAPTFIPFFAPFATKLTQPTVLFAFAAGGLGSTISGTLRIRQVDRISELEAVGSGFLAQVGLGAALAVVVLIILNTGLVSIGGIDSAPKWIAIGFAAGFSEPFAIGILEQVSKVPSEEEEKSG